MVSILVLVDAPLESKIIESKARVTEFQSLF